MKASFWGVACASVLLAGCPQVQRNVVPPMQKAQLAVQVRKPVQRLVDNGTSVVLRLATPPVAAVIRQGDRFGVTLSGTWAKTGAAPVYLQVSDDAGLFVAPAPALAPKRPVYQIAVVLPTSTAAGSYSGTLSVRACADSLCTQPYDGSLQSIGYTVQVKSLEDWGTLQGTTRHDGYVPVQIDPTRYTAAWTFENQNAGALSGIVTDGNNVYFYAAESPSWSMYALRASDGALQWRHVFSNTAGGPVIAPPTVADGTVFTATTGYGGYLFALRASDGIELYRSVHSTQADSQPGRP